MGPTANPPSLDGGGENLVCLGLCGLLIQGKCLLAITQKVKSCNFGISWAKGRDSMLGPWNPAMFLQLSIMTSRSSRPLLNFLKMCASRVISWENQLITRIEI